MPTEPTSSIEARLARLERSNRRLRLGIVAGLCGLAALGLMGATAAVPSVIQAHGLELLDGAGRVRASLTLVPTNSGSQPTLQFEGTQGNLLAQYTSGSVMFFEREAGNSSRLSTLWDGDGIMFWGGSGAERAALGVDLAGLAPSRPALVLHSSGGDLAAVLPASAPPAISLADAAGFSLALGGTGLVSPETGETRQTSAASIVMFGNSKAHHVIWQAPNQ